MLIFLASCNAPIESKQVRISVTTWIGYTPLFYAKEKGWLEKINVKLINVVSLSENMYLYQAGNSDAYCGTQYEHSILKKKIPSLVPVMLFDRSNGGDMIMGNHTIEELQKSNKKIHVYLEMDSINYTLLQDFIAKYDIDESRINYIDRDQAEIASLHNTDKEKIMLIVTYVPFDSRLKKNGFTELLSTKQGLDLFVIDALFTRKEEVLAHKKQFTTLKKMVDKAIAEAQKDPKSFYDVIKPYQNDISYEEFVNSLHDITWINQKPSEELIKRMQQASLPTKDLL